MAKRFTDTAIWEKDFFLNAPIQFQHFWHFVLSKCDHAGLWTPNKKMFEIISGVNIDLGKALDFFNSGQERIKVLASGKWFFVDFFRFQYGSSLNPANRVHASILAIYEREGVDIKSLRPQIEVNLTSNRGRQGVKDKDKDKDIDLKNLRTKKKKFLDHVLLTEEEHQKLLDMMGQKETDKWIKALDDGISIYGYKYKSHYKVILKWREKEDKVQGEKKPYADVV